MSIFALEKQYLKNSTIEMKKFMLMFAVILAGATALVLTSCSSDDEPSSSEYVYSVGVTAFSGNAFGELTKLNDIYNKALIKAFGTNDGTIAIKGSEKDCDAKVRKACEEAQVDVEKIQWNCSFTYTATQINHDKVVYQYSYPSK